MSATAARNEGHVDGAGESARPLTSSDPRWEDEVARLLRRPESLRCVYQPVVDLRTGDCAGYEALTRVADWPARSPQPWFTAAARTGLAGQLEAATLANALRGRKDLVDGQFLAVNIAAGLIDDPAVAAVLRDEPDLGGLVVELGWTDTALDEPTIPASASALRARGLLLACDVVDGGRLELDRLHRTSPDLVKLDSSLVKGAHADPVRDRLVRLVIAMADELGAVVLAEGLESLDDARYLQKVGIRMAQGWLFGRARPSFLPVSAEVATWLRTTWEETVTSARVGRLVQVVPTAAPTTGSEPWVAELDDDGRLVALVNEDGERLPASRVVRLRASQDLRSAAVRLLASGRERAPASVLAIADDEGRFLGISQRDTVLREVLGSGDSRVPLIVRR